MNRISRLVTTVAVSGGVSLAGLALGAGTAQADTWCPGDHYSAILPKWDMGVCHDYYWAYKYDANAPRDLYLEGTPPGPPVPGFCGRDMFFGIPLPC